MTEEKILKLQSILKDLKSFVLAFSGGVDSSFLAYFAGSSADIRMTAVTLQTPYIPNREISEAREFSRKYAFNHVILDLPFPEIVKHNPVERCYLCKKILFSKITEYAVKNGFRYVIDGTNSDDLKNYRPGIKALNELSVRSPLAEAGITKKDIRDYLYLKGLEIWDKPAMACLLTRIPYDTEVNESMLRMIEAAENYLFENGYPGTRVRVHNDIIRIECMPGFLEKIINDPGREVLVSNLKKLGFRYISLDLEGYRSGSMDLHNAEK
jgi:pyridinium-3,5-biscarboxylic acid mononucleotide sulfurtransferase